MLSDEERQAKEAALSGLTGGSFGEIIILMLVIPVRNFSKLFELDCPIYVPVPHFRH
jgi:hypothetical protein